MPELPEVETLAEELRQSGIVGSQVQLAQVYFAKTVAVPSVDQFCEKIKGKKILGVGRRGKYLLFELSNSLILIIHLRMTGRFLLVTSDQPRTVHEHVILTLNQHRQLRFHDTRKFGRWYLVAESSTVLSRLGPEPLAKNFTLPLFSRMLKERNRQLKPLLLDQTFLAGLGNIYVDEALWEAKLHPQCDAGKLSRQQCKTLFKAIKTVLERGINAQGTSLGKGKSNFFRLSGHSGDHQHLLNVFRRNGESCPRCGTTLVRLVVAQRGTHICPSCQRL